MGASIVFFLGVVFVIAGAGMLIAERRKPGSVAALFKRVRDTFARSDK